MPESWNTRFSRWGFNLFPAYRSTGAWVEYIADDWKEVRIRLPLTWRTRNYVGTTFGGSMYSAVDPMYMMMLIKLLGRGYEVWDKSATIRFRRPGRGTLRATFLIHDDQLNDIQNAVDRDGKTDCSFHIELMNEEGEVAASCDKVVHIRRKRK